MKFFCNPFSPFKKRSKATKEEEQPKKPNSPKEIRQQKVDNYYAKKSASASSPKSVEAKESTTEELQKVDSPKSQESKPLEFIEEKKSDGMDKEMAQHDATSETDKEVSPEPVKSEEVEVEYDETTAPKSTTTEEAAPLCGACGCF